MITLMIRRLNKISPDKCKILPKYQNDRSIIEISTPMRDFKMFDTYVGILFDTNNTTTVPTKMNKELICQSTNPKNHSKRCRSTHFQVSKFKKGTDYLYLK